MCNQQSLRSACTYVLSDLSLCLSHKYSMSVKLLTEHHCKFLSLKVGCTGSSESTLVKLPHCWKSHVTAHMGLLARNLILLPGNSSCRLACASPWGNCIFSIFISPMHRSRKFRQRGSKFDIIFFFFFFFLVDEGIEDRNITINVPSLARQRNTIKWRFAGGPTMAQH